MQLSFFSRTYIYYDAHLLDTFFDGGGDVNLSLVAAAIVARWAWPYIMTQGVNDVREVRLCEQNTELKT